MTKRYSPNDPISTLHDEFSKVQKSLIEGEISHADLSNWFLDFCDKIGCETTGEIDQDEIESEVEERVIQPKSKKNEIRGFVFHCDKNGDHVTGAITYVSQTSLKLIMSKLKKGYALFKSPAGCYTILKDQEIDLEKVNPETV
jgi:hypothetical protein